jgi:hypothetical protein
MTDGLLVALCTTQPFLCRSRCASGLRLCIVRAAAEVNGPLGAIVACGQLTQKEQHCNLPLDAGLVCHCRPIGG